MYINFERADNMKYDINKLSESDISILDNIVFLDIETSGLNPITCEIIEIGAIKLEKGKFKVINTLIKNNK